MPIKFGGGTPATPTPTPTVSKVSSSNGSGQPKVVNINAQASKVGELTLPTGLNQPSDKVSDYTIMLAGEKKIGKSAFAAQFPNHFILECEPGNAKHLTARFRDVTSWPVFKKYLEMLEANPNFAETYIIDDIPSLSSLCQDWVCKQRGIEHPSDQTHGKGWNAVESEFKRALNRFQALPGGKIYTAHNVYKEYEKKSGAKFSRLETSCGSQADRYMDAVANMWMVMQYGPNRERIITIQGDELLKAGCDIVGHFIDKVTKKKLINIPMGDSAEQAYMNFCKAWDNEMTEAEAGRQDKPFHSDAPKRAIIGKK